MITQLLALLAEANDDIRELERVQEKLLTVSNDLEELNQQIEVNIKNNSNDKLYQ